MPTETQAVPYKPTRDEIRKALFNAKPNRRKVQLSGMDVEVQQPLVEVILSARQEDTKDAMLRMIIDHTYMVGTDEKIFDIADRDIISKLPFTRGFADLSKAMTELTGLNIEEGVQQLQDPT